MKAIMNAEAVTTYIDYHKKMNLPFKIILSTYTTRIISDYCDIYFMRNEQSNRVFSAYAKVKKDVKQSKVKKINVSNLQYYSHNFPHNDFYSDIIYNIDIKSAYASILYNDGYITRETFNYLKKLPKMDRLASVGMLAGKKNVFNINQDGNIISEETIISETSDYFFYCVKRTSEIINQATKYLGEGFLFSWVDGIYFLENEKSSYNAGKIFKEYFYDEYKLLSTFETLKNFEVTGHNDFYNCKYIKEDKKKFINIPRHNNIVVNKITEHLLTKTY
jgi:hypothetical protein